MPQTGYGGVLGLVSIIILFVQRPSTAPRNRLAPQALAVVVGRTPRSTAGPAPLPESAPRKGCAVAAQPSGKAATTYPSYLHTAEVADLLYVSPKTVSRWAKEGRLPFLKTLGGHAATQKPRSATWPRDFARKPQPERRGPVLSSRMAPLYRVSRTRDLQETRPVLR
jgi:excisionase family DNA binding protein